MDPMIECAPNFSEGRNMKIVQEIVDTIKEPPEIHLLNVSVGRAANRTIVTFVGTPECVKEAAFKATKKAAELIDMRKHKGEHPRIGAVDVCPFIPVKGVTMEECVQIAIEVGKRIGEELGIPVYLYENAATAEHRRNLEDVRAGEYESLPEKLRDPMWKPDYGPCGWNENVAKNGATIIGARDFLIAFNVNLNTKDKKIAQEIAKTVRKKGYVEKLPDGTKLRAPLKVVKAIGWYVEEYGRAQVSINLTNYKTMPLWKVFETCVEEAGKLGVRVTGSEIVGLAPKEAILEVGRYYLRKQGKSDAVPEGDLIDTAILSVGLNEVTEFKPAEKILEYKIESALGAQRLANLTIKDFMDELSRSSPVPGGGSVAALLGSLSASLSSMVSALTYGKKKYKMYNEDVINAGEKAQELKERYLELVDKDARIFKGFMSAFKLPRRTREEKVLRRKRMQEAAKRAIEVPMGVLKLSMSLMDIAEELAEKGNKNAVSDAGVSAVCAYGAAYGAYLNVLTNLVWIYDRDFVESTKEVASKITNEVEGRKEGVLKKVLDRMSVP